MKKYLFFLFIALCLVLMGCSSSKKADDVDDIIESLKLTVEVKDALNEEPVEGAMVMVEINGEITNKEIDENGQAVFILKPGNYQISAAKDNYISNGIKRIKLERDYEVIIEMGKEIEQIIENDTKIITNGLYELDFSEISEYGFITLQDTVLKLEKSVYTKDDINDFIPEDSDGINIVGNIITVNLSKEGQASDITAKIKFRVPYDIEGEDIDDYGLMIITEESGESDVIFLENIEREGDAKYLYGNIDLVLKGVIIDKLTAFIYEKDSENIDDTPEIPDESAAIEFIEDLKEHGINLNEVGNEQADIIKNNFNNSLNPYATAISRNFEEMWIVFEIFDWLRDIGPGKYKLNIEKMEDMDEYEYWPEDTEEYYDVYDQYLEDNNYTKDDIYYYNFYWNEIRGYKCSEHYIGIDSGFIVSYESYDYSKYSYDFTFDDYNVMIKPISADGSKEIESFDKEEGVYTTNIYLTDLTYSFKMTSKENKELEWSFDFSWKEIDEDSIKKYVRTKKYKSEDYYYYEYIGNGEYEKYCVETHIFNYYYPDKATMEIKGIMTDNQEYLDDEGNPLPSIGEITLDGVLDMFVTNENLITYDGKLESEEFDFDGDLEISFREKPTIQKIIDEKKIPLSSFVFDGYFSTSDYKLDGLCNIYFLDQNVITNDGELLGPLPNIIRFDGTYNYLSENYFTLFGYIGLEIIYDNYRVDFSDEAEGETEEDYLPFIVSLGGSLSQADYADSLLNFRAERKGYKKYEAEFEYRFPENRYIVGEAENTNSTNKINVQVYNQNNLLLEFNDEYSGKKIGEIRNRNNEDEVFGEIYYENGEPVVRFREGKTISLLP